MRIAFSLAALGCALGLFLSASVRAEPTLPFEEPMADSGPAVEVEPIEPAAPIAPADTRPAPVDLRLSVVRVNSTQQAWNPAQPWEKAPPRRRRALCAIVAPDRVLAPAEMVADVTYLEFESPDGTRSIEAAVLAVDYEANLALLGPADEEAGAGFFSATTPFELADSAPLGSAVDVLQVEDNGQALLTAGLLQGADVSPSFLPGQTFLNYLVKASMQSAAGSYSLPVLREGKLAGMLLSYDSQEQICRVAPASLIRPFLDEAQDGGAVGFPSLGVSVARTDDPAFREWLGLGEDEGGVYISRVRKGASADRAGLRAGDVVLEVDGKSIDRRGFYRHPLYGNLFWGHLVRGERAAGERVTLRVLRDGERQELPVELLREDEHTRVVPNYVFDRAPDFLVKGGMIFQELSRPLLEAFGEDWTSRAPLNLLDAYENQDQFEGELRRVVFLSAAIPTPATIGYERLRNLIVRRVNGRPIRDVKSLIEAFEAHEGPLHSIEFVEEDFTVYLDQALAAEVDRQLLRSGLTQLSRAE